MNKNGIKLISLRWLLYPNSDIFKVCPTCPIQSRAINQIKFHNMALKKNASLAKPWFFGESTLTKTSILQPSLQKKP